eukprot:g21317.t1
MEELEWFTNFTNTFHPNLKFTWTFSDTSISFLDLSISISGDSLKTDTYFKPTDSYSYLDYTFSHPPSCKNAIPYSQFLPVHHVCPTTPGTFPCNCRKCYTCPYTSFLTSIQGTKQTFHIRQGFTCTSVNVVYCICCSQCGLLYIGETKQRLGDC